MNDEEVLIETADVKPGRRSIEETIKLPLKIEPGLYMLSATDLKDREIASDLLMVCDGPSLLAYDCTSRALDFSIQAHQAATSEHFDRAKLLFEEAAQLYLNALSPQCAGLALTSAAEIARDHLGALEAFEGLGWSAVRCFLIAGDVVAAGDVTRMLVLTSSSLSDAALSYVETSRAALEFNHSTILEEKQEAILEVAGRSFPVRSGELITRRIIASMRDSQRNQYVTNVDELLHLLASEIAVYAPGALIRTPDGPALHCVTFASELQEAAHAAAAAA